MAASHPPPKRKPLTVSTGWKKNRGGTATGCGKSEETPPLSPPLPRVYLLFTTRRFHYEADSRSQRRPPLGSPFCHRWSIGSTVFAAFSFDSLCNARNNPTFFRSSVSNNRTYPQHGIALQQTLVVTWSKFSGYIVRKSLRPPFSRSRMIEGGEISGEKAWRARVKSQGTRHFYSRAELFFLANFSSSPYPFFPRDICLPSSSTGYEEKRKKEKRRNGGGELTPRIYVIAARELVEDYS